jgi:HlyD family secretion protein
MANSNSKRTRRIFVFLAIILTLAGLTTAAVLRKREALVTVQTEQVTRRNITELVVANGRIQPVVQVKISPEVSGEIIELPVKEGQSVQKGDLLLKIKPDYYKAACRSADAAYKSAVSGKDLAEANLRKAQAEFKRIEELFTTRLVSDSSYIESKTALEVGQASFESAKHQINVAKAALDRAQEDLAKTTIYSPLTGTVSKLNSQLGERVVGTAMMTGTEVMIIADLNEMEARVDIGEVDVVLIATNQVAHLEVDAFRDQKFNGVVTEIANSSKIGAFGAANSSAQEATKFEVKIRIQEKEIFRPGMSVTAEIETRYRTNVLSVPIQSVTTRLPKEPKKSGKKAVAQCTPASTNTTLVADSSSGSAKISACDATAPKRADKKPGEAVKPIEVMFSVQSERAVTVPVKRGISDDAYVEIIEGAQEGQEVVSGGYKAISRDLDDGKRVKKGAAKADDKEKTRS